MRKVAQGVFVVVNSGDKDQHLTKVCFVVAMFVHIYVVCMSPHREICCVVIIESVYV